MLERKKTELEKAIEKQRSENEVSPALFVFPSAEALLRATESDRVQSTWSTHGTAHQCVHNSAVLSSWSTPIGSGVGAAGLTEYQKSFHAQYLTRTVRLVKEINLCSTNQNAVMLALTSVHPAPMLRRLELDVPEFSEPMVQCISQWEAEGRLDYLAIRLHRITPTLKILCSLLSLKELNLSETFITDEEIRQLSECHTLVKIDLRSCDKLTNVSPISSIATLEEIDLSECSCLTHVGALGKLRALKEVNLRETRITDGEVRLLSESHTLVKINLHSCGSLTNVNPLSSIATLEVIKLSDCRSLTCLGALGKLPVLKEVDARRTRIKDEEVRLLSDSHSLEKIILFACGSLTNVNPLSSIATLEVIKLSRCRRLKLVASLGRIPNLMRLDLRDTAVSNKELESLTSLRKQLSLPPIAIRFEMDSDDESPIPSETEQEEERDFYRYNTWLFDSD